MFNHPRHGVSNFLIGLGIITTTQVGLMLPTLGQYQGHDGDIVVIGESPSEWARFRAYWLELLQLSNAAQQAAPEASSDVASSEPDPAELEAKIKKNLAVSNLKFMGIRSLSGSSQVIGSLTNKNKESVTIASVSFEIVDQDGTVVRSGAATPQPSTIAPGQTVTFSQELFGFPARSSYEVQLTQSPFVIQGGV